MFAVDLHRFGNCNLANECVAQRITKDLFSNYIVVSIFIFTLHMIFAISLKQIKCKPLSISINLICSLTCLNIFELWITMGLVLKPSGVPVFRRLADGGHEEPGGAEMGPTMEPKVLQN